MEVKVIPEKLDDCIKLLVENRLEDTKAYDGCETCYGSVDKEKSIVTLWTQWSTVEHGKNTSLGEKKEVILQNFHPFFLKNPKYPLLKYSIKLTQSTT